MTFGKCSRSDFLRLTVLHILLNVQNMETADLEYLISLSPVYCVYVYKRGQTEATWDLSTIIRGQVEEADYQDGDGQSTLM